jgi:hypothetical protein
MAQQSINLGTTANDGTGDTLRAAGLKVNSNFTEVYSNVSLLQIYTTSAFGYANITYAIAQSAHNKANNSDSIVSANVAILRGELTANATSGTLYVNSSLTSNVSNLRSEITANAASANSVINTNISANVATIRGEITANATASLTVANLKSVVAISTDFADFKVKVAAL